MVSPVFHNHLLYNSIQLPASRTLMLSQHLIRHTYPILLSTRPTQLKYPFLAFHQPTPPPPSVAADLAMHPQRTIPHGRLHTPGAPRPALLSPIPTHRKNGPRLRLPWACQDVHRQTFLSTPISHPPLALMMRNIGAAQN